MIDSQQHCLEETSFPSPFFPFTNGWKLPPHAAFYLSPKEGIVNDGVWWQGIVTKREEIGKELGKDEKKFKEWSNPKSHCIWPTTFKLLVESH